MQQLEAHEMPLIKVFSSEHQFRIPDYQRPYSWEGEQTMQLLSDLSEAIDREDEDPYFLGSLVLIKTSGKPDADVVDGQQRLTTITILLAVLRSLATDPNFRDGVDKMILEPGNVLQSLAPQPRLRLRERDADFFRDQIQEPGALSGLLAMKDDDPLLSTDARGLIRDNARSLHTELLKWEEEKRERLLRFLATQTFLVIVSTPNLESAHRIFSVMNARGLDLDPADIFKSEVIGKIPEPAGSEYAARWEDAEEALGRDAFSDLFLHIRMIFSKVRARRELLKEFPEQVLKQYEANPKAFVDEVLVPYAKAQADIDGSSYTSTTGADKVNAWFGRLRQLDNSDWRPPALWFLRQHRDSPALLDEFFSRLERLAGSMFIRRVYTTPRVTRYAELLKELEAGHGIDAPSLELSSSEREETLERLNDHVYLVSKTRRYILQRLDETLANEPGVTYEHRLVTVEHVLPQNPEKDSEWTELFDEGQRDQWTHRLANLVLLNRVKNPAAGRKPFEDKKETYFSGKTGVATFALTVEVVHEQTWTPTVLAKRQERLLGVLADLWNLHVPEPNEELAGMELEGDE